MTLVRFHPWRPPDRGTLLVALLILLIVGALIGAWGLSSTHVGFLKAGHYRGSTKLQYSAEEALQRALRRIQEISDPLLTDFLFGYGGSYGYGDTEHTIDWLVNTTTFPTPSLPPEVLNPACPDPFDPEVGLDDIGSNGQTSNAICNFLGASSPGTQVILVRKNDVTEGTQRYAVYLVNAVARDAVGRKKLVQGVAILPYEITSTSPTTTYGLPVGESAYLATIVKSSGD
ncbi:MAG: hypothetical protein V1798_06070 [Pseudomonadota bacterium]